MSSFFKDLKIVGECQIDCNKREISGCAENVWSWIEDFRSLGKTRKLFSMQRIKNREEAIVKKAAVLSNLWKRLVDMVRISR